jgi:flavin reductase
MVVDGAMQSSSDFFSTMSSISPVTPDLFRNAMASFASGIFAITSETNGLVVGMIATSVCSVSADPASLLVCVNKTASIHDVIIRRKDFNICLLSTAHVEVAKRFSASKGEDRFDWTQWRRDARGIPKLENASVALRCTLLASHDAFTHSILIGGITDIEVKDLGQHQCLLWHRQGMKVACDARDRLAERPT